MTTAKKRNITIAICAMVIVIAGIFLLCTCSSNKDSSYDSNGNGNNSEIAANTAVETVVSENSNALTIAEQTLSDAGWSRENYRLGMEVVESDDTSLNGSGDFSNEELHSPQAMVTWLNSGTDGAEAAIASLSAATGAERADVLDQNNWVAVQPLTSFNYPGNTGFLNGQVTSVGNGAGNAFDIFLLFCYQQNAEDTATADTTASVVAVRGACGNIQLSVPTPVTPEPTPTPGLTPKDPTQDVGANPDVADWKKDGGETHEVSTVIDPEVGNSYQPTEPEAPVATETTPVVAPGAEAPVEDREIPDNGDAGETADGTVEL